MVVGPELFFSQPATNPRIEDYCEAVAGGLEDLRQEAAPASAYAMFGGFRCPVHLPLAEMNI